MKKLYVGNLSYQVKEEDLENIFSEFGKLLSVTIIRDKHDNSSKGFGFIEMESDEDAMRAINELDGADVEGRNIRVSEAREKRDNRGGGGGGGRGGRGGGGRGGRGGGGGGRGGRGGPGGNRW